MMNLPKNLIDLIRQGRAVLFLGAGATIGAQTSGKRPPLGNELRDRIAQRFLTGDFSSESLSWVSELAMSASSIFEVQDFIASQFQDLAPAKYHYLTATFRWRGIATTNYDLLIEMAYNGSDKAVQKIVPFLSNSDSVDEKLRLPSSLALLKLHGCITRTHDEQLPLILTIDQYNTHKKGRSRLFQMFEEWASENTIIFVGHKLQDPNLRGLLLNITQNIPSRSRYYLIRPEMSKEEIDFWAAKSISVLDGTFEHFLQALDGNISKDMRQLAMLIETDHPIRQRFKVKEKLSAALLDFMSHDFEYVHEGLSRKNGSPHKFYSGFGLDWYPIIMDLDVRRMITDRLIKDVILRPEEDRPSHVELYVIKAEAGAGKSVLLRRLAWEAANKTGVLCLYSRGTTPASIKSFREIAESTGERLFLFIDNAADNLSLLREILEFGKSAKLKLTLITAERVNEWNILCESLEQYLSDQYLLNYLNRAEIEILIRLLEKHDSLGPNLARKTFEEQIKEFDDRAGRQLLVALHEATHGIPFEEIIYDEFNGITPAEAQRLYLTVCVLNRLGVPVRAGLISRTHSIPFEIFQERFFKPLEHVIHVVNLPWGDYGYKARHREIAQIVFERVLTNPTDRFNEYIRIIRGLNPMFATDNEALRGMLRAKWVHDLFPNYEDAKAIYDLSEDIFGGDAYLLQQRANYERVRPSGNLQLAQSLLEKAREIQSSDPTIMHTLAEVLRARAEIADKKLERTRFRSEAKAILKRIANTTPTATYATVTELKLNIDEVRDLLSDDKSIDRDIDAAVRDAEKSFEIARQRFPGDKFVLTAEAEFAKLLEDHERSFKALMHARKANPRDPFIASRLASILVKKGDTETAMTYIKEALDGNRGDKRLNFQYAELLRAKTETKSEELAYYYHRAFSKWDNNYESQFWYARFTFESGGTEKVREVKDIFKHLREIPMPYDDRVRILDVMGGFDTPRQFSGAIDRLEDNYGYISIDGRGDWIFFHESDTDGGIWDRLTPGTRVTFKIGFSLRGPKALALCIL